MHTLFKQQTEKIFVGLEFSCVVISNIYVSSRFIMALYDTLLILIFCKNVLCHIGRTGGRCAIFVECTAYYCDELFWGY